MYSPIPLPPGVEKITLTDRQPVYGLTDNVKFFERYKTPLDINGEVRKPVLPGKSYNVVLALAINIVPSTIKCKSHLYAFNVWSLLKFSKVSFMSRRDTCQMIYQSLSDFAEPQPLRFGHDSVEFKKSKPKKVQHPFYQSPGEDFSLEIIFGQVFEFPEKDQSNDSHVNFEVQMVIAPMDKEAFERYRENFPKMNTANNELQVKKYKENKK